jgi:hypothetical protein
MDLVLGMSELHAQITRLEEGLGETGTSNGAGDRPFRQSSLSKEIARKELVRQRAEREALVERAEILAREIARDGSLDSSIAESTDRSPRPLWRPGTPRRSKARLAVAMCGIFMLVAVAASTLVDARMLHPIGGVSSFPESAAGDPRGETQLVGTVPHQGMVEDLQAE